MPRRRSPRRRYFFCTKAASARMSRRRQIQCRAQARTAAAAARVRPRKQRPAARRVFPKPGPKRKRRARKESGWPRSRRPPSWSPPARGVARPFQIAGATLRASPPAYNCRFAAWRVCGAHIRLDVKSPGSSCKTRLKRTWVQDRILRLPWWGRRAAPSGRRSAASLPPKNCAAPNPN